MATSARAHSAPHQLSVAVHGRAQKAAKDAPKVGKSAGVFTLAREAEGCRGQQMGSNAPNCAPA
jgi:hypothetical protein